MGAGTQKIEGSFDVRNLTKPIVAAGQVTDAGQGVWLSGDGGFILDKKSAKKIEKLLGDKERFIELRKQKGVYVIPCEDQMRRTGLRGQRVLQSSRMTKREREEHEVTHATFRSWCEACVAGRATEDAHRRSAKESSVPMVAMDHGLLGRNTDAHQATILVLAQRPHGACQVLRKGPELYAIDCGLAYLDSWGLAEVVLKSDNEPAIQALVDGVRIKRGERTMVEKSPQYSHQSNGAAENAVRRIESLTRTYVCVLQEKIGYKVDSKSIILPWLVRHAAYVLNRYIKRDGGRSAWARLRGKECDCPLVQIGETVDFKIVRGEMAKLEPRWAVGTFLERTDESDEVIVGTAAGIEFARSLRRRAANKQWERDAFTTFIGVPWNPRGLAVEAPVASSRRRYITKTLIHLYGETPGCAACLGTASQHTAKCTDTFEQLINPSVADEVPAVSSSAEEIQRPDDGAAPAQNQQQTTEHSSELPVQQAAGTKREEWRTDQHFRQQRDLTHRLQLYHRFHRSETSK